jgi:hypothetical protein
LLKRNSVTTPSTEIVLSVSKKTANEWCADAAPALAPDISNQSRRRRRIGSHPFPQYANDSGTAAGREMAATPPARIVLAGLSRGFKRGGKAR